MQTNFSIDSKWLLCVALLLWQGIAFAQTPAITWQKSLGGSSFDYAKSIQQTTDGGYIVAGYSYSNDGDVTGNYGEFDYWIAKLGAYGNLVWQKNLGGSADDWATAIQQTKDGGYIVAGISSSNSVPTNDYRIVKLDANGNLAWQKSLGGSGSDAAYSIQQCTDGGYIVAGISSSTNGDVTGNHGVNDCWIVKLDSAGTLVWQKSLGGSSGDAAFSIQQCTDGGYIVAGGSGSIDGDVTGNHGNSDYWIVKLDANGNLVWQKSLGGSGSDYVNSIQQTIDGGYIMAGRSGSIDGDVTGNHGNSDYWIVKLASDGTLVWQKCLGGSNNDEAYSIQQNTDGGYIVAGVSQSTEGDVTGNHGNRDYWIVKLASDGTLVWQKCLGGSSDEEAYSIQQTTDGGYIVAGYGGSVDGDVTGNHGDRDYWIVKLGGYGVSIEETSMLRDLSISPNPVVGNRIKVAYYLLAATTVEMRIIDVSGECVWCGGEEFEAIGVHSRELDLEGLASGLYFLEIRTKYGKEMVRWVKG